MQQGTPWKKWNKLYTSLNTLKYAMFSNWFFPASVWQSGGIMRMGDYANVGARQNSSALPSMPLPPPNWSSVQVQHEGQGLHQQPTVDGGPCLLRWVYQNKGEVQDEIVGRSRGCFIKVRCFLSRGDGDVLLLLMSLEMLCDEMLLASLWIFSFWKRYP